MYIIAQEFPHSGKADQDSTASPGNTMGKKTLFFPDKVSSNSQYVELKWIALLHVISTEPNCSAI